MTFWVLLVGGWCVLSFAVAGAIGQASIRRRRQRDVDHARELQRTRLLPSIARNAWVGGAAAQTDPAPIRENQLCFPHVCDCCGHTSTLMLEQRRAG